MIRHLETLEAQEVDLLLKAPALVAILIAGAENVINKEELEMAEKIVRYRRISGDIRLFSYYDDVNLHFHDDLLFLEKEYPEDALERNKTIARELEGLNEILPKLKKEYAVAIYDSLKDFARHVAQSAGGFLGFLAISSEEKAWINLSMIKDPKDYMSDDILDKDKLHINPEYLNNNRQEPFTS